MTNFIESQNAVTEFFDVLKKNSGKSEIKNAWNAKLAENGVTITDKTFELPRKLVESINTALLNTKTDKQKQSRLQHSLLILLNL